MDDPSPIEALIEIVTAQTCTYLNANAARLARGKRLLRRFQNACASWKDKGQGNSKPITEAVNELLVARRFLQDALCLRVEYEPPLDGTQKTIDFLFHTTEGNRVFYDVKTVHPQEGDGWSLYERARKNGWLSPGTNLVLDPAWGGAELAHDQIASRRRFQEYTLEFETKIRSVPGRNDGRTYFRMVFGGDGWTWRPDQLEDFAETYLTGGRCESDHFAKMEAHSMLDKNQSFERTIHGFCYFERAVTLSEPTAFRCDVHVPTLGV